MYLTLSGMLLAADSSPERGTAGLHAPCDEVQGCRDRCPEEEVAGVPGGAGQAVRL